MSLLASSRPAADAVPVAVALEPGAGAADDTGTAPPRRRAAPWSGVSLPLLLALPPMLFLVLPMFLVIPMSFTDGQILAFPPSDWGFGAYREVFADEGWRTSILFSLEVAALAVVVSVTAAGLAAIGVSRCPRALGNWVSAVVLVPLSMPVVVLALGSFQMYNEWGLTGTLLGFALSHSVIGAPYVFITVRAALAKMDVALVRSAMSLGAGTWSVLRWVYLPAIGPALLSGALLVFIVSFDEVVIALFISGPAAISFPVKLFTDLQFNLSPAIMAISTLLLAVVVSLVLAGLVAFGAHRTVYRIAKVR